jgi:ribA/ribD-fused uncharacterized protein
MWNYETLRTLLDEGATFEYELFWKGPFSQWAKSLFVLDGIPYPTAEHWMMAEKARLFKDEDAVRRVLAAKKPDEAKFIGRYVQNYNDEQWAAVRFETVIRGNIAKFEQNPKLGDALMATGNKVLVEASPFDTIWGIGMGEEDPRSRDPRQWLGQNLLGFALMEVRSRLFT